MVPFYQLAVDLAVAAMLLFVAIYSPFFLRRRRLPQWAELAMALVGVVLLGGVIFALLNGHWPFRG